MEVKRTSLLEYLKSEAVLDTEIYDCLRYELDKHIYYYGDHFKRPVEKLKQHTSKEKLKWFLRLARIKVYKFKSRKLANNKPLLMSNAYFNFNGELIQNGYEVITPPWAPSAKDATIYDASLLKVCFKIKESFELSDFSYLISGEFISLIDKFTKLFEDFIIQNKVKGIVVSNDESFFENCCIKICRKLAVTSFIFLHGLPGRYNQIDENRSDYLVVWGNKIKQNYINNGFEENKIFVSGHPMYNKSSVEELRFGLSNILVLAKTGAGSPHSTGMILYDRGNLIVYLLSIQQVLRKLNVNRVRLRFHPSSNSEWYYKFIDKEFFLIDNSTLSNSLISSTLVIGPVSTVFLEALVNNVNYLVYEPSNNNVTLLNERLAPPFDGSEDNVPVAHNADELLLMIKSRSLVNSAIFNDYISSKFDISFFTHCIA